MPRPTVLVVEPRSSRRRDLALGLAALGYEVIPALDETQGRRFAERLESAVVVAPLGFMGNGGGPAAAGGERNQGGDRRGAGEDGRTLLLLGEREEQGEELPAHISYLATGGLSPGELVRRVHLLLLGREVGVGADAQLESLIGDLALVPFLELLRALHRAEVSGRLVHEAGEVTLIGGQVVAAVAGPARGVKAFCRLSHLDAGPVRVVPAAAGDEVALGRQPAEREIKEDMSSLIIRALEDRVHDAPALRSLLRLEVGADFFQRTFTPHQKELLVAIRTAGTVGRLLDVIPDTDGDAVRGLRGLIDMGVVVAEEPEAAVRVVTDSTSDLPADLARAHGIQIVPLLVIFGDRIYHDGVDLAARQFYEKLETEPISPRTNPPPRADFLQVYRDSAATKDILSIHASGKLSQTVVNARAVVDESRQSLEEMRRPGDRPLAIEVVDSASISLGLGMLALFAARMAQRGLEVPEIARRIAAMRERLHVLFVVDSLDYLARGGRIGKARALLGKVLGVKPILGMLEGEVAAVDRVRGGRAAHPRLVELFARQADPLQPVVVAIGHAKAPIWADRLRALLTERFLVAELLVSEIGPVVGTHGGPGTVGAALFQPIAEELPLISPLTS